ncbi:LPS-assembly lipoprotein LptE [Cellvibrio zantedeschiae]|uniref:LPS-assembly lipoprotein LptE n=1 Tax=Cellvibrio zantedeschiae TaxID=1237077 RepID=A0ABQ3B5H3_9GAMM|nr:LPS assembly lipoprotein LptE [Cellvibrio zantedeschiae]GGY80279.1 LPS-assembly lipoprotein LptE [Cellvibrio zantedeschiae]
MKKIIALALITLGLTACGWHIRGSVELPKQLSNLYVSATDSKGALITDVRQLLKTNRVKLAEKSADANYSLNILEETKDRHTAGVGGDELSSAYEITLKANYEIHLKNTNQTIKGSAISVRNFNYNTAAINSATQEELLLEQEMRRDLAQQILRRLSSVVANPPSEKSKPNKSPKPTESSSSETSNGKTAP